jgi:hypothetical protein
VIRLEEHDLRRQLGEPYQRYLVRVPRFAPRLSALAGRPATVGEFERTVAEDMGAR